MTNWHEPKVLGRGGHGALMILRAILVPFYVRDRDQFDLRPRTAFLLGLGIISVLFALYALADETSGYLLNGLPPFDIIMIPVGTLMMTGFLGLIYGSTIAFWCRLYRRYSTPPFVADIWLGELRREFLSQVWLLVILKTLPVYLILLLCGDLNSEGLARLLPRQVNALTNYFPLTILAFPSISAGLAIPTVARWYPDGLQPRCWNCGYSLRGLGVAAHCPECGLSRSVSGCIRLLRKPSHVARVLAAAVLVITIVDVAYVPVGLVVYGPRPTNPDAFRLGRGEMAIVRRDQALGVVQLSGDFWRGPQYVTWFWKDSTLAEFDPADRMRTGVLAEPNSTWFSVGPWSFEWSLCGGSCGWIYRPDESYQVTIVSAETIEQATANIGVEEAEAGRD